MANTLNLALSLLHALGSANSLVYLVEVHEYFLQVPNNPNNFPSSCLLVDYIYITTDN